MRLRFFFALMMIGAALLPLWATSISSAALAGPKHRAGTGDDWFQDDPGQQAPSSGTILHFPGMPPIQVTPGGQLSGPGWRSVGEPPAKTLKPSLSPEEQAKAAKAEALKQAMAPQKTHAQIRGETLEALFKHLQKAADPDEAKGIATAIQRVWLYSDSATADLLMARATAAMQAGHLPLALTLFDQILVLKPGWVVAWDRRAMTRVLGGDFQGAVSDMQHVLKLEPRQFSTLTALGFILHKEGLDKEALGVFRKSLALDPQQPEIKGIVDKLSIKVEGRDI